MPLRTCSKCGTPITSHGKGTQVCRACYQVEPKACATCGRELPRYARGTKCRDCWKARGPDGPRGPRPGHTVTPNRTCERCGSPISKTSRPEALLCIKCYLHRMGHKGFRTCVDCGNTLNRGSKGTRCWSCHLARKRAQAGQKRCNFPGCERPYRAKGFCLVHYQDARRGAQLLGTTSPQTLKLQRRDLNAAPCQVCGYDRVPSHLHRIIPGAQGGKYVIGNVVAVCARCHEEIHRGLIPCPAPFMSEGVGIPV